MNRTGRLLTTALLGICFFALAIGLTPNAHSAEVRVSRFWHNHQPIYWPEWNSSPQNERIQFAQDSINLKSSQYYDSTTAHPENDLNAIFGVQDRINAYQSGPRNSLSGVYNGGYSMSYSGSLIDNVNNLGANGHSGYGTGWWDGNREATKWLTSGGSRKMDMVGFTYHHSLGAVLPKAVFRKELQIFHEAAYKAWDMGTSDNRSKGFFPTEMAFSQTMIEVLEEEGYEWAIVASHHLSRTIPNYSDHADPEGSFNIYSSPPNKADQINPSISDGWWFGTGNVGETAWNVAPFAYQLHKAKYVNPDTGAESSIIMVPSDDIQSYKAGYSGWQQGLIDANIAPYATDPARPCIVMPSTDGDNAWGGGSSSWGDAASMMNNGSYPGVAVQDFVNDFGGAADTVHVEDGAWIFPESDYGSPYFLKWVEPPASPTSPTRVPNTQIDIEGPGFTPKFYSWAPIMSGANWCETAEQIWEDLNGAGTVAAWKIQDPYNNLGDGLYTSPNIVERAWHIYLGGLDSGFQYYGGEGNDDEVKTSLATRRAVELLQSFMSTNMANDATPPTVFKPQRFPYNPGAYTFGWFNIIPGDGNALKKMDSEFYIWTHAYDVSGITNINVIIRKDNDGSNSTGNNENETYAGGSDVGNWVTVPMTKRVLPIGAAALTAAANNSKISYFDQALSPEVADYYYAKINDAALSGFRGKLLDYYIESTDALGNTSKSDIQHVWVEDDGLGGSTVDFSIDPRDCAPLEVTYTATAGVLDGVSPVYQQISFDGGTSWTNEQMSGGANVWSFTNAMPSNTTSAIVWFQNTGGSIIDSNDGANWNTAIRDCDAAVFSNGVSINPAVPTAGQSVTIAYDPAGRNLSSASNVNIHYGYNGDNWTTPPGEAMAWVDTFWVFTYPIPAEATSISMVFNDGSTWDNNGALNWNYAVNPYVETVSDGVIITNPIVSTSTVAYALSNTTVQGTAGTNLTSSLMWTNSGTGLSGTLSLVTYWSQAMDLAVGDNPISVSAAIIGGGISTSMVTIVREAYVPPVADGVAITNPIISTITVAYAESTFAMKGTAGTNLTAGLTWTNSTLAQGGGFIHTPRWSQSVELAVGTNVVTVSGIIAGTGASTATNAADAAVAYSGGWTNGSNEGSGFEAWTLGTSSNSGHFVSENGWGFWSHEGGNLSEAIRPFSDPFTSAQSFSVFMKNGWIWESGGSVGVALRDSVGATLWELYFNGGDTFYNTPDGATDIGWTDAGLDIVFTVTDTNAFSVEVHPLGGSARQYNGTFAGVITDFRAWSYNNGTLDGQNSNRDFYLDNLLVTTPVGGSESYSIATVHIIRETDGSPVIPPIVFEPGTGFSFDVPAGYDLDRVEGADALTGEAWDWTTLVLDTDYTLESGTLTILTTGITQKQMIRIWLTAAPL
jgi:Starch/carbohydrate-binding module (family 53)/Glycosyl hydrolase family 57